jgi:quercetin dioxygenase-like cupin family protein
MFENDYIQVIEHRLVPTARVDPQLSGDCMLVSLTATTLRINGETPRSLQNLEIYWSDAGIDTIEAVGDTEAWVLVARFKGDGPSMPPAVPDDNAMILEPDAYRLIFENRRARVARVTSRPGEKTGMHSHPGHVFRYVISPNRILSFDPDGTVRDLDIAAGVAFWREEPSHHSTDNIGATVGQLVLIEVR